MKHLRDFRIFESDDDDDDEDSTIHTGFEYSFNDIKDTFWDILDLGFKIKENRSCYWSEDFTRVQLTEAKWACPWGPVSPTGHAVELEKEVLKYFGFQTPKELSFNRQWTTDPTDETLKGYKQDYKDFLKKKTLLDSLKESYRDFTEWFSNKFS